MLVPAHVQRWVNLVRHIAAVMFEVVMLHCVYTNWVVFWSYTFKKTTQFEIIFCLLPTNFINYGKLGVKNDEPPDNFIGNTPRRDFLKKGSFRSKGTRRVLFRGGFSWKEHAETPGKAP